MRKLYTIIFLLIVTFTNSENIKKNSIQINPIWYMVKLDETDIDYSFEYQRAISDKYFISILPRFGVYTGQSKYDDEKETDIQFLLIESGLLYTPFNFYLKGFHVGTKLLYSYYSIDLNDNFYQTFSLLGQTGYQWIFRTGMTISTSFSIGFPIYSRVNENDDEVTLYQEDFEYYLKIMLGYSF